MKSLLDKIRDEIWKKEAPTEKARAIITLFESELERAVATNGADPGHYAKGRIEDLIAERDLP